MDVLVGATADSLVPQTRVKVGTYTSTVMHRSAPGCVVRVEIKSCHNVRVGGGVGCG